MSLNAHVCKQIRSWLLRQRGSNGKVDSLLEPREASFSSNGPEGITLQLQAGTGGDCQSEMTVTPIETATTGQCNGQRGEQSQGSQSSTTASPTTTRAQER